MYYIKATEYYELYAGGSIKCNEKCNENCNVYNFDL